MIRPHSDGSNAGLTGGKRLRPRGQSISGRLRSVSDMCESRFISPAQKGVLKDLIIIGDPELDDAFERYEKGDPSKLKGARFRQSGPFSTVAMALSTTWSGVPCLSDARARVCVCVMVCDGV